MRIPTAIYYLPRRVHVFWTAFLVYLTLKTTQRLNKLLGRTEAQANEAWSRSNTRAARIILSTSSYQRGLWIKCCQYVAARSDALPEEYTTVLSKSLDDCPATASAYVRALVNEELARSEAGKSFEETHQRRVTVDDLFADFDAAKPIASASIAQVHVAKEKASGSKVVLKIQHPNVKPMLLQDLIDLKTLLRWIAGAEPKYDMRPLLDAWIEMVPFETDFVSEKQNLDKVKRTLELTRTNKEIQHLSTVSYVPTAYAQYSTEKVLVMEFIEGYKLTDVIKKNGNIDNEINKKQLVDEISKSFGAQLFLCDTFSADPHSGNFLVSQADQQQGGNPVLLDFGMCVKVSTDLRLGFARLILASYENDSYSLVQALADIGLKLNRADPSSSLEVIKYLFRTTSPREESMQEQKSFAQTFESSQKKEEIKKNELENPIIDSRSSNVSESEFEKKRKEKGVVDAFPGHLVFFFRSLGMLRGLAVSLEIRHSYLKSLRPYAEYALRNECPVELRLKSPVYNSSPIELKNTNIEVRARVQRTSQVLERILTKLYKANLLIGLQVAVHKDDELVIDMCAGRKGSYNQRPITPDTIFNSFSTTKGLTAILFAYVQDEYNVEYEDLVTQYWPEYGQNGKEKTKIKHILSHTAGLAKCFPKQLPMEKLQTDWKGIITFYECAEPSQEPGTKVEYHALSFGWLVAGLIMKITKGRTYQDTLLELVGKLNIQRECFCGTMTDDLLPDVDDSRVARLSSFVFQDLQKGGALGNVVRRQQSSSTARENSSSKHSSTIDSRMNSTNSSGTSTNDSEGGDHSDTENEMESTFEEATTGMQSTEQKATDILKRGMNIQDEKQKDDVSKLPTYLMDLNFYNHPLLRGGFVPSANGHFSARALAKIYSLLANNGKYGDEQVIAHDRIVKMRQRIEEFDYNGRRAWGAGLTLYDAFQPSVTAGTEEDEEELRMKGAVIGHGGIGGSMAFAIPEHGLSLAVTVNKLNALSIAVGVVIAVVCNGMNVPVPESYHVFAKRAKHLMTMNDQGMDGGEGEDEASLIESMFQGASQEDMMKILVG